MNTPPLKSTTDELIEELERYDAGLINDFGGGNVGWWQDYIRAELDRAHDHYADQHDALIARIRELEARTVTLPPPYPMPEPDEYSIDDSYMDPYYAANGMRSACSSFIKNAGVKVFDPHSPEQTQCSAT